MKRNTQEIRRLIMECIEETGKIQPKAVVKKFGISQQAVFKNVRALIEAGLITRNNEQKNWPYRLCELEEKDTSVEVSSATREDRVWTEFVSPHLGDMKDNVREIFHYGFTEMFNNIIDHSQSKKADINIARTAITVTISVRDYGIGIWKKLQEEYNLDDPRHALLELTKGKLTTDPQRHTGEGIFFTSRMFDTFVIESDRLSFCRFIEGDEWLFDVKQVDSIKGTNVMMRLRPDSTRTPREVFDKFSSDLNDYGFTRTNVSVQLAQHEGGDHLVSRSQAKRLLARLEKFKEVFLNFDGVTEIGQAFADEIFRVFPNEHPNTHIWATKTTPAVDRMIARARLAQQAEEQTSLPLPKI